MCIRDRFNATKTLVYGNESHLINIIVNLLDNALKYCENSPKIILETASQKNNFLLNIKDNGIGMNPSTQKKIFDKFYRETSGNIHNVRGHGLGLAYVKKIVDFHKGEIKIMSKVDGGTTFSISLPINQKN